ncbi:MAG: hypothetical protein Q8R40_02875 [bacterium]|nr:hypothetical protein [bacterium]
MHIIDERTFRPEPWLSHPIENLQLPLSDALQSVLHELLDADPLSLLADDKKIEIADYPFSSGTAYMSTYLRCNFLPVMRDNFKQRWSRYWKYDIIIRPDFEHTGDEWHGIMFESIERRGMAS